MYVKIKLRTNVFSRCNSITNDSVIINGVAMLIFLEVRGQGRREYGLKGGAQFDDFPMRNYIEIQ